MLKGLVVLFKLKVRIRVKGVNVVAEVGWVIGVGQRWQVRVSWMWLNQVWVIRRVPVHWKVVIVDFTVVSLHFKLLLC